MGPLVAQNSTFSVTATIWDDALDQAAEPSVLAAHSWDCSIALVNGTLNGTTEIMVGPGDNMATFDDIMVEEAGLSYDLEVTCVSSDGMTGRKKRDTSSQPLDLDLCLTPLTEDC